MKTAETFAELSHAKRLHVGAIVVKDDRIISIGYNGMPSGWDNNCEDKVYNTRFKQLADGTWMDPITYEQADVNELYPYEGDYTDDFGNTVPGRYRLVTKKEVLHAERNALDKLANQGGTGAHNAAMFVTHSPCLECAKSIYGSGISKLYYSNDYRSSEGIDFLKKCGITVVKLSI